jgi:hypothetical protein
MLNDWEFHFADRRPPQGGWTSIVGQPSEPNQEQWERDFRPDWETLNIWSTLTESQRSWQEIPWLRPATLNENPRDCCDLSRYMLTLIIWAKLHEKFSLPLRDLESQPLKSQLFRGFRSHSLNSEILRAKDWIVSRNGRLNSLYRPGFMDNALCLFIYMN